MESMSAPPSDADTRDPFATLGVAPTTPFSEVKVVYRRLVRELHPDVNPGDPHARDRFDAIQLAFEQVRALYAARRPTSSASFNGPPPTGALGDTPFDPFATGTFPGMGTGSIIPEARAGATRPVPPGPVEGASSPRPTSDPTYVAGPSTPGINAGDHAPPPHPTEARSATPASGVGGGRPASGPLTAPVAPPRPRGAAAAPQPTARAAGGAFSTTRGGALQHGGPSDLGAQLATGTRGLLDEPGRAHIGEDEPALGLILVPGRDRLLLQQKAQMLYVLLELKRHDGVGSSTQPLNLSLVLDHSSSMQRDDKLQRLKEAVSRIIDMMDSRDYLSIVTFGDRASVLLPSQPLGNKRAAKESLDGIRCRGGTEISTGIRAGLQELQAHSSNLISQMIVLTDGQTYGDEELCLALATQAGERQVQITALGLGDDWNSALLDEMAARTAGFSDYVQTANQLSGVFEENLRTLQQTAIRNLRMDIRTGYTSRLLRATSVAPGIKPLPVPAETPSGQPVSLDLGRLSIDRDYRVLLELVVAGKTTGIADVADVILTYDVPSLGRERESVEYQITTTFVERWDSDPPVDLRVHDALRKITAHRLQEQAMQAINEGQTQKGTASLRTAAKHLEAAGCPDLATLANAEADRVERQGQAQAGNMKRIIYGTRRLG